MQIHLHVLNIHLYYYHLHLPNQNSERQKHKFDFKYSKFFFLQISLHSNYSMMVLVSNQLMHPVLTYFLMNHPEIEFIVNRENSVFFFIHLHY